MHGKCVGSGIFPGQFHGTLGRASRNQVLTSRKGSETWGTPDSPRYKKATRAIERRRYFCFCGGADGTGVGSLLGGTTFLIRM